MCNSTAWAKLGLDAWQSDVQSMNHTCWPTQYIYALNIYTTMRQQCTSFRGETKRTEIFQDGSHYSRITTPENNYPAQPGITSPRLSAACNENMLPSVDCPTPRGGATVWLLVEQVPCLTRQIGLHSQWFRLAGSTFLTKEAQSPKGRHCCNPWGACFQGNQVGFLKP